MAQKPHALCIPIPGHGHINVMLKLANILHFQGFHITFVNPEFKTKGLFVSQGSDSLPVGFHVETISDGTSQDGDGDTNYTASKAAIIDSIKKNGLVLVRNLISKLNSSPTDPPVSCIVWDCFMPCITEPAEDFDIPQVMFWPMSASVLMTYLHREGIAKKMRLFQEKNEEFTKMHIDFIPGLKNFQTKDLPSFFWDGNEVGQNLLTQQVEKTSKAPAIILHTFDELESEVLHAMKPLLPPIYTIGPLNFLEQQIPNNEQRLFKSNLFKENQECIDWLNSQNPNSVVYINFGSTTFMTGEQLIEFAWGLANSKHPFLWVIRIDLVRGQEATLPLDFISETADRSMICSWCPQEKVLNHPSTGVFLTHCGWNSTMDTMSAGVPVINWPFYADQQTNCWSTCVQWRFGMEIDKEIKRNDIEGNIREAMEGMKGKEMKKNVLHWRKRAEESTKEGGSSYENLEKVIKEVMLQQKKIG